MGDEGSDSASCMSRFDNLLQGMAPDYKGNHDACAHVFNDTDSPVCPPACQGNITALLRDCVNKTVPGGNQSWDAYAAQLLQQNGPADCNYTVPPNSPSRPLPGPGLTPASAPSGKGVLPSWGVPLIIAGSSGVALAGVAAVVVRRRRTAQRDASAPLLDEMLH